MSLFESIPRTLHAEQFHADAGGKMINSPAPAGVCFCAVQVVGAHVHPWEDLVHPVRNGDWIVPTPDSRYYFPIPDAIFHKLYRAIDQAASANGKP